VTTLITDHPAWITDQVGLAARVVQHDGSLWFASWTGTALDLRPLDASATTRPPLSHTPATQLPHAKAAHPLVKPLSALGTVARLTNPSLWDAITTAILRQVVRAAQARKVYRRWCSQHGQASVTPAGPMAIAPGPESVLRLSDEAFAEAGAKFHRTALQAAAAAYQDNHERWAAMSADELVKALDEVPRIGPWTASAAAADYTGDFSVYPHGDLAVRTWARAATSTVLVALPEAERDFEARWRHWAPDRPQLHALTLFTLTWGSHARTEHEPGTAEHER
jgi:DNA-3-methyladenine glycosylase II